MAEEFCGSCGKLIYMDGFRNKYDLVKGIYQIHKCKDEKRR